MQWPLSTFPFQLTTPPVPYLESLVTVPSPPFHFHDRECLSLYGADAGCFSPSPIGSSRSVSELLHCSRSIDQVDQSSTRVFESLSHKERSRTGTVQVWISVSDKLTTSNISRWFLLTQRSPWTRSLGTLLCQPCPHLINSIPMLLPCLPERYPFSGTASHVYLNQVLADPIYS